MSENREPGWETSPPSNHDLEIVLEHKTEILDNSFSVERDYPQREQMVKTEIILLDTRLFLIGHPAPSLDIPGHTVNN